MEPTSLTPNDPTSATPAQSRSSSRAPNVRRQETEDSEKAGRVWAREAEEDPWAPCILTLDGGGIRGYSSLLILKALMHEVWEWEVRLAEEEDDGEEGRVGRAQAAMDTGGNESPKRKTSPPVHYFDFMYGTSTGGLIATLLGRLRMSVPEALTLYRTVGDDLFGSRRSRVPLMTKYHHEPLERAVRSIVASRCTDHPDCDGNDLHPWPEYLDPSVLAQPAPFSVSEPRVCQSCCLTATHDSNISEAYLLRSYPHYYSPTAPNWITRYNEGAAPISIWRMARATTAAPFYFEMLHTVLEGIPRDFKDGGIRENNPAPAALSEFHSLYEGTGIENPALLLSVGTGRPDTTHDGFADTPWPGAFGKVPFVSKFLEKRAVLQNLLIKYTEGEHDHQQMRSHARGENTWYKRLNVSEGLEQMGLDSWERGEWRGEKGVAGGKTLSRMEDVTGAYLGRGFRHEVDSYAPPGVMLGQVAEKVVRMRRAREGEGGERWDVFVGKALKQKDGKASADEPFGQMNAKASANGEAG
ncbi:uncharacterized protein LTR77_006220 [Saxophila tyrrhenica]|uniref:PNPLA domain-containing protein n=1 Tax=Saxophila tyrrhenica TaxID=1690608 RepID=A0AAV9P7J1_9PEZI|nr:hypothetical protein LTR77_006220 [Saxophila tyrrhenica]